MTDTRDEQIINLRFEKGLSLRSLAKQFQISHERVRQILERETGVTRNPTYDAKSQARKLAREQYIVGQQDRAAAKQTRFKILLEKVKGGQSFRSVCANRTEENELREYAKRFAVQSPVLTRHSDFTKRVEVMTKMLAENCSWDEITKEVNRVENRTNKQMSLYMFARRRGMI